MNLHENESEVTKCLQEVLFEWFLESKIAHNLKTQCQEYGVQGMRLVYRLVILVDIGELMDFSAALGGIAINNPKEFTKICQEVCFLTIQTLNWIIDIVSPSQLLLVPRFTSLPSLPGYIINNLSVAPSCSGHSRLFKVIGIVSSITTTTNYTQSARFYCPNSSCVGSSRYCYIRLHTAGASEADTIKNSFSCSYCDNILLEDMACRTLSEKCVIQMISTEAVSPSLWLNGNCKSARYQPTTLYVRDELIDKIQLGECYNVSAIPWYELHEQVPQAYFSLVFEVNNIELSNPMAWNLPVSQDDIPKVINNLYQDRKKSPWSFSASLAYCFGGSVTPPGTFIRLKLAMLLSLMSRCEEQEISKQTANPSGKLDLLFIGHDLLILQKLQRYGASFASRMLVHTPSSDLITSLAKEYLGSGTCFVHAGCLPLARGGVCLINNLASSKKDILDKLQAVLESRQVIVDIPEKYTLSEQKQLSFPLECSVWACSEPHRKTSISKMDPDLIAGQPLLETQKLSKAFMDQFSLIFCTDNTSTFTSDDYSDNIVMEDILKTAMSEPETVDLLINDEDFKRSVTLSKTAKDLIQAFYLASRRVRTTGVYASEFPLTALQVITSLAAAHAKLSLRDEVSDEDAIIAIMLYEESITLRNGYSVVGLFPILHVIDGNVSAFIGPENDKKMTQFQSHVKRFCAPYFRAPGAGIFPPEE